MKEKNIVFEYNKNKTKIFVTEKEKQNKTQHYIKKSFERKKKEARKEIKTAKPAKKQSIILSSKCDVHFRGCAMRK